MGALMENWRAIATILCLLIILFAGVVGKRIYEKRDEKKNAVAWAVVCLYIVIGCGLFVYYYLN